MMKMLMRIVGGILILVGIVGFFTTMPGMLNLTIVHDLVHLVSGVVVLAAAQSQRASILVSRILGTVYLAVGLLGLAVHNVFGLIYLMPADTVIHFALAILFLAIGFSRRPSTNKTMVA